MTPADGRQDRVGLRAGIGLLLLLAYVLPIYVPPPPVAYTPATVDTPMVTRLFPQVPAWWVMGRLLAVLLGAWLVTGNGKHGLLRLPRWRTAPAGYIEPWTLRAAFVAALTHVCLLPFARELPYAIKSLYVLWIFVPTAILIAGNLASRQHRRPRSPIWRRTAGLTAGLLTTWIVVRLIASWHSPVAADSVDMFRTLGGLVRLATTGADFMTESMGIKEGVGDIEVRGVNAVQLFFCGLPLLRLLSHSPCLWWMQVASAWWLGIGGLSVAALGALLFGRRAAAPAMVAFLFAPFLLMIQIIPIPTVGICLATLLAWLPVQFRYTGSPIPLVLLGGIAGFTATLPSLTCLTGFSLAFVAWGLWQGQRVAPLAVATASASLLAMLLPNVPTQRAVLEAFEWYVTKNWPMAIGEAAVQGQISPTIADWMTVDPPGSLVILAGTVLSPFVIPRQPIKLWGDTLFEPLSAALAAVGLLLTLRRAGRGNTAAWYLLALLAATMVPGFVSSYDRASLTRIYGTLVPVALMAALGLNHLLRHLQQPRTRRWAAALTAVAITASGLVVFDVVHPRILAASSYGIFMRTVDPTVLDRTAFLTVDGPATSSDESEHQRRHWEADWLRAHHPYIADLTRCAPRRPVPIVAVQNSRGLAGKELLFWNPALDQTVQMTERHVCQRWPQAVLFTIADRSGLSRLYGAQVGGPAWQPSAPPDKWSQRRCGEVDPLGPPPVTIAVTAPGT